MFLPAFLKKSISDSVRFFPFSDPLWILMFFVYHKKQQKMLAHFSGVCFRQIWYFQLLGCSNWVVYSEPGDHPTWEKKVYFCYFERFGLVIYISEVRFGKISTTKLGFTIFQSISNVNLKNMVFTFFLPGSLSTTQKSKMISLY